MQGWFNIGKSVPVIHRVNKLKKVVSFQRRAPESIQGSAGTAGTPSSEDRQLFALIKTQSNSEIKMKENGAVSQLIG